MTRASVIDEPTGLPWSFSDPRLEGSVSRINEESRIDLDDGRDIYLASTAYRIENDGGAWQERPRTWFLPDGLDTFDWLPEEILVFDGQDGYGGLVAVLRSTGLSEFRGYIMDARLFPPSPVAALTE